MTTAEVGAGRADVVGLFVVAAPMLGDGDDFDYQAQSRHWEQQR